MQTHEEIIRANPELVRSNLADMIVERDGYLAKLRRARSPHNQAMWKGRAGWAQKMVDRYQDDIRIIEEGDHA
jgi:hypothetical protein